MIQKQQSINQSRIITQFTINNKQTPQTRNTPHSSTRQTPSINKCDHCQQYIVKVTQLKQRQVILELKINQLQEKIQSLSQQNTQLINKTTMTYEQYHKKMQQQNRLLWDRKDLQAQLFQSKTLVQLLLLSKSTPSNPHVKPIQFESLKQKYSNLLIQQLRMQQQLMIKDRIIQEKVFNPIYNFDSRVITLRKAVAYWYKKAEEECSRMKQKCKDIKKSVNQQIENIRQTMNNDIQINRETLRKLIQEQSLCKGNKKEKKIKSHKMQEKIKNQTKKMR